MMPILPVLFVAALQAATTVHEARVQAPATSAPASVAASGATESPLRLKVPVAGVRQVDLRNTYYERRGGRAHEALDIPAPRGTAVVAAAPGRITKLFTSVAGGVTIYEFDSSERYALYYAHLDRYASDIREGMQVSAGRVIGYVGSTGNAAPDAPHLHFAVFRLGPGKEWWKGDAIDAFGWLSD